MRNLLVLTAIALLINACNFDNTSTTLCLNFEESYFVRVADEGNLNPVPDALFKLGEDVNLAMKNVSGFKKGEDGLNWLEMEMEVYDMEGKLIVSLGELLGESGHLNLENNTAELPYASLNHTEHLQPGKYKFKITVYDKVGNGQASQTMTFNIE